jgi:hypothetical protein
MKNLRPLALLALTTAAAQAYNVEFQFGANRPAQGDFAGSYKGDSATGLSWSTNVSEQVSLGTTFSLRQLEHSLPTPTQNDVKSLMLDLVWELGSERGGLKPFFGGSIGNSWIDTPTGNDNAITGILSAGLRFNLSDTTEFVLGARYFNIWNVNFSDTVSDDVKGWETYAAIRLKF